MTNEIAEAPGTETAAVAETTVATPEAKVVAGFTPEDIKKALEESGADARLAAELEASRRSRGHISDLQKRLTTAEKAVSRLDAIELGVKATGERLDKIVASLPNGILDAEALAALAPQRNETVAHLEQRLEELAAQLEARNTAAPEPEIDPEAIQARAQWDAATTSVQKYAQSKGVTITDDDPQWGRVYRAAPDDPSGAAIEMMRHIDGLVEKKARQDERKDASENVTPGARTPRVGAVTLEQMKNMSREEIAALPREVRAAALAAG